MYSANVGPPKLLFGSFIDFLLYIIVASLYNSIILFRFLRDDRKP